jgi:DNA topoisomerase IB
MRWATTSQPRDFRTWAGTVLAAGALCGPAGKADADVEADANDAPTKRRLSEAVKSVARTLGNTPAVCRRSYIHPDVVDAYLDGSLVAAAGGGERGSGRDAELAEQGTRRPGAPGAPLESRRGRLMPCVRRA